MLVIVFNYVQQMRATLMKSFCPTNPDGKRFMIIKNYHNPEISKYENLLKSNGIEIAGIEYIKDKKGVHYTYDINTNTNYNSIAERKSDLKGMDSLLCSFTMN